MTEAPNPTEAACLEAMRRGDVLDADRDTTDGWIRFGLAVVLEACRTIRSGWAATVAGSIERKSDGTPGIELEREVEAVVRGRMARFAPDVPIVGEESGGALPETGWALAVDPIDGTWAFFNGTGSACTSLGLFRDGRPIAGVVANPSTGEFAYGGEDIPARLLRISVFGEGDRAIDLPIVPAGQRAAVLVSVHPSRDRPALVDVFRRAWADGLVQSVRAPGGAPAWGIIEAAKGRYTYVNQWTSRAAEPFDLAAAVAVLRAAGGEAVDLDGVPIDETTHAGPFVAGIEPGAVERVVRLARESAR